MPGAEPAGPGPAVCVTVGVPLGVERRPGDGETDLGLVRLGARFWRLPLLAYELWLSAAAGVPPPHLREWGRDREIEDVDEAVGWLRRRGLLVVLTGGLAADGPVLRTCRLVPAASGADLVHLDAMAYAIWCCSDGACSLSSAVDRVAAEHGTSPASAYEAAWPGLAAILRMGGGRLDEVVAQCSSCP